MVKENLFVFNRENLPENFVSLATKIVNQVPTHAGILIRHNHVDYLHHFPGTTKPEVSNSFDGNNWYIYKIIDSIENDEDEVGSYLQWCKRLCENSQITYGYIADGSTYDDRGEFISRMGLPEFGTCVGFCVNTLSNTILDLQDTYFHLEDWDDSEIIGWVDSWSLQQAESKYPNLDWTIYNAFKKRITPMDYISSGFVTDYPIKKAHLENIKKEVQEVINSQFVPIN